MLQEGELEEGEELSEDSGEYVKIRRAGRTEICGICRTMLSKYTCPRCRQRTCSLSCSKKHKLLKACNGLVDPTEKIEKKNIQEKTVQKDFQFVKEMLSNADKVKKTLTGISSNTQQPKRFQFLRKQAKILYNITIHHAPSIIERHRENISFYFMKTKTIYWVLEFLYYRGKKQYTRYLTDPVPDQKQIIEVLPNGFLCGELILSGINTQKVNEFSLFILNKIGNSKSEEKIIEIERSTLLSSALINLHIYQFPTIYVVHNTLKSAFLEEKK